MTVCELYLNVFVYLGQKNSYHRKAVVILTKVSFYDGKVNCEIMLTRVIRFFLLFFSSGKSVMQ